MNSGKDKKLTLVTKNPQNKKPNIEIDTHTDHSPAKATVSNPTLSQIHSEDTNKGAFVMTSPTNFKNSQSNNIQSPQSEAVHLKKLGQQKKTSQKDPPNVPKIQFQSKMTGNFTTNGFVSPKAALNKQKLLTSHPSEKVLPNVKFEKKDSIPPRDTKAIKIEQLQKIVQESKLRQSQLTNKQSTMGEEIQRLKNENNQLRTENIELKKKIQKYKLSNEQTKKMLKQRIHTFNQQSGQMQAIKNQIKTLEERVETLLQENQSLKAEINKFSDFNLKDLSNLQGMNSNAIATSNIREVHMQGSRISQLYLRESNEHDLLQFTNMENMEENLNLESYITEAEESYIQQYKTNVDIFDKIKQEYEVILEDIEIRYKTMSQEYQKAAQQQATEIQDLQYRIDQLHHEQKQGRRHQSSLSISLDEMILRNERQIAMLNMDVYNLRDANKQLVSDVEHYRAQCRFLEAELDIERMKKKFKNENDKFEYNVVKLNLLTIIDKLKMQIDKYKEKYIKISEKYKPQKKIIIQTK